jgi:hypothetical protein
VEKLERLGFKTEKGLTLITFELRKGICVKQRKIGVSFAKRGRCRAWLTGRPQFDLAFGSI